MITLVPAQRGAMTALLDRLVPAVDHLSAAGAMGILADIEKMVAETDRFGRAILAFAALLVAAEPNFTGLPDEAQDEAIRRLEESQVEAFARVLEIVYIAYYSRPEVGARIGWRGGPLQPRGFELPPWDESILETIRKRAPLWREA